MSHLVRSLSLVLALAGLAGTASAQTAQINVNATILSGLSITPNNNLDFGQFVASNGTISVPKEDNDAGQFVVTGNAGQDVSVTFTPLSAISNGASALGVALTLYGADTDDASGATTVNPGDSVTLNNADGSYYFFLSGSLINTAAAAPGVYTAQFTLEVDYTGS